MTIEIPIKCNQCGRTIKKRLGELTRKTKLTCRCGATFTVDPAGFKSVAKGIDDLRKAVSKLGK